MTNKKQRIVPAILCALAVDLPTFFVSFAFFAAILLFSVAASPRYANVRLQDLAPFPGSLFD